MQSSFSDHSFAVVREFARNLGFGDVRPVEDGSVSFEFERAGTFSITPARDGRRMLLSLSRNKGRLQAGNLKDFLSLSSWDPVIGAPVNAGMSSQGGLVLVVALDGESQTLQMIELCLDRLIELHASL